MRTVVIGAGLAGLVSAIRIKQSGQDVVLLTKGIGGIQLGQGTVDVWGYKEAASVPGSDPNPNNDGHDHSLPGAPFISGKERYSERVVNPFVAVREAAPTHPYHAIGIDNVKRGLDYLLELLGPEYLAGSLENALLPTAVGALRPTLLYPPSMVAGVAKAGAKWVIVGIKQLKDFGAALIAGNLARAELPGGGKLDVRSAVIDFPAREGEVDSAGFTFAKALDNPETRRRFAAALKAVVQPGEAIGLPAVLGLKDPNVHRELQAQIGAEVFEIPLPPPSVPGMRMNEQLTEIAKAEGVRIVIGSKVNGFTAEDGVVVSVSAETAGKPREYKADHFVYAPGGFESGALRMDSHYNTAEQLFNLPLAGLDDVQHLITEDYWGDPQAVFKIGVNVDTSMRPLDGLTPVYSNLHAAGGILGGSHRWKEKSGEGIALGSAIAAADAVIAASGESEA
ncbi:MAG: glycerol-3-phosphate dehydrogenase subunit GlpB [Propionibacteriaceae bacterium]|nr:glycerol-3-phosphate dehydrogenase subunit GlpB [Propionibacteriaceae bacterium]